MNLKEHSTLQSLIAFTIIVEICWTLYEYSTGGVWSWEFNLLVVILLVIISNGLLLERRFSQLREEMIQDKVEYGLQTGENLEDSLDYED